MMTHPSDPGILTILKIAGKHPTESKEYTALQLIRAKRTAL